MIGYGNVNGKSVPGKRGCLMVEELSFGDSYKHGAVAQLGEHLTCTEGVAGSSPVSSTNVVVTEEIGGGLQTRSCECESHPRL